MVLVDKVTQCFRQCVVLSFLSLSRGPTCKNKKKDIQTGTKKTEINDMRAHSFEEKVDTVAEIRERENWKLYQTDISIKNHLQESLPYKNSSCQDQILDKT